MHEAYCRELLVLMVYVVHLGTKLCWLLLSGTPDSLPLPFQAMRRFDAHSVAVGGVQVISPDYFVSWGNRQQFLFLWKVRRDNE